jgi:deazaflavin-dependent oxidoreductase (nitroreductase family)
MRRSIILGTASIATAIAATLGALALAWSRDHRLGAGLVNRVIDPYLLRHGMSGVGRSEIGTLEHVGRRSGTRYVTPVHPVPTDDGFRIVVPIGGRSQWALNVLAAGHCRLQLHDIVHELDEPVLLEPDATPGLSLVARWVGSRLGFRYLMLHELSRTGGSSLEPGTSTPVAFPKGPEADVVAAAA